MIKTDADDILLARYLVHNVLSQKCHFVANNVIVRCVFVTISHYLVASHQSFQLKNNFQNCGPRPTGPMWPHPPLNTNHNPQLPMHCDMLADDMYVQGYKCNTTCQAAPEKQVQVQCSCLRTFMGITLAKSCEWVIKSIDGEESTECPPVPDTMPQFDWQCDPRIETCSEGSFT